MLASQNMAVADGSAAIGTHPRRLGLLIMQKQDRWLPAAAGGIPRLGPAEGRKNKPPDASGQAEHENAQQKHS